jgi:hypothetical protein
MADAFNLTMAAPLGFLWDNVEVMPATSGSQVRAHSNGSHGADAGNIGATGAVFGLF